MPEQRKLASRTYTVYFVPEEEGGGYTADIPALGVVTEGETLEEARDMAKDAIEGWIEAARELGKTIPDDVTTAEVEVCA